MEREKIALGALVVIIVAILGLYILSNEDVLDNLLKGEDKIEIGDCVDVHYIGRYTEDGVFAYSYSDFSSKKGGTPLNIYVNYNSSSSPPEGYGNYSNNIILPYGEYYNKEFIEGLVGLEEGEKATIGPIQPDDKYGVRPAVGDLINFTKFAGYPYFYKIYDVKKNVLIPSDYRDILGLGNITTNMYKLRDESHYKGEIITSDYPFWANSTIVTKINETLIWKYTTPKTSVGESFTYIWTGIDEEVGGEAKITYPTNCSYITSYNNSTITVKHDLDNDSNISLSVNYPGYGYIPYITYNVQNVTEDKINTSYQNPMTGGIQYKTFNRTTTILRNRTEVIMQEPVPGELLEQIFSYIRSIDDTINFGYNPFTVSSTFEVEIVKIYKTSEES